MSRAWLPPAGFEMPTSTSGRHCAYRQSDQGQRSTRLSIEAEYRGWELTRYASPTAANRLFAPQKSRWADAGEPQTRPAAAAMTLKAGASPRADRYRMYPLVRRCCS